MTSMNRIAASLPAASRWRAWGAGIRRPVDAPHAQPRRRRQEWVCFLVVEGAIELLDEVDGEVDACTVERGWLHVLPPGVWQASREPFPVGSCFIWWHMCSDRRWRWLDREAALHLVDDNLGAGRQRRLLIPRQLDCREVLGELRQLHGQLHDRCQRWGSSDPSAAAMCTHLAWRLHELGQEQLVRGEATAAGGDAATRLARRARWLITERYRDHGSLGEVAARLGVDPSYLARCFVRATGETVGSCILATRVAAARELIRQGQHSLKEVAALCGFSSLNYFCRQFRRAMGQTPGAYRRGSA